MPNINYKFVDSTSSEPEVSEDFYNQYLFLRKKEKAINRKETRRHQSIYMSLERGWDFADSTVNVEYEAERKETIIEIHNALKFLTEKQRTILIFYAIDQLSFREIGDSLGISKVMVRKHYLAATNKMKNILR